MLTSKPWRLYFKQGQWFISSLLVNCSINHTENCALCRIWNLQIQQTLPEPETRLLIFSEIKKKYCEELSHCMSGDFITAQYFTVEWFNPVTDQIWPDKCKYKWLFIRELKRIIIPEPYSDGLSFLCTWGVCDQVLRCSIGVSVVATVLVLPTQCQVPWVHL